MLQPLLDLAPSGSVNISPTSLFLNILPALLPLIGVFVAPALPSILDTEVTDILPKFYAYFSPTDKTPTLTAPTLALATPTYTQEVSHVSIYAVLACIVFSMFGSSLVIGKLVQPPPPPPSYPPPPPPSSSLSSPAAQPPKPVKSHEYDGSPPPPPPPPIFTTPITDPRIPHKAFLAWVVLLLVVIASVYSTLKRYTVPWWEVQAWLRRTFQRPIAIPSPVVPPTDIIDIPTTPTSPPVPPPRALIADATNALVLYARPIPPALSAQPLVADATNALVLYSLPVSPASSLRGLIGDNTSALVLYTPPLPLLPPPPPIAQHQFVLPSPPLFSPNTDRWVRVQVVAVVLVLLLVGIGEVGSTEGVQTAIGVEEDVREIAEEAFACIKDAEVETGSAIEAATSSSPLPPTPSLTSNSTNALVLYLPLHPPAPSPRVFIGYPISSPVLCSSPLPLAPSPRALIGDATNALVLYSPPIPPAASPRPLIADTTSALVLYSPPFLPPLTLADRWVCMEVLIVNLALLLVKVEEVGRMGTVQKAIEDVKETVEEESACTEVVEVEAVDEVPSAECIPPALVPTEESVVAPIPSPVLTLPTDARTLTLSPISPPFIPTAAESARDLNPEPAPFSTTTSSRPTSQSLNAVAAPSISNETASAPGLQSNAANPSLPRKPTWAVQNRAAARSAPGSNIHGLPRKPCWVPPGVSAPLLPRAARPVPGAHSTNAALGLPPRPHWIPPKSAAMPFVPTSARSGSLDAPSVGRSPGPYRAVPNTIPPSSSPTPARSAQRLGCSAARCRPPSTPHCVTLAAPAVRPAPACSPGKPGFTPLNTTATAFTSVATKPAGGLNSGAPVFSPRK